MRLADELRKRALDYDARASRAADLGDKETADISAAVALALHELAEAYEQAEAA